MFQVKEKSRATVTVCANGHEMPNALTLAGIKFCYVCGQALEEQTIIYDAAICAECKCPVSPEWNFCPYCGQGRR